MGLGSFNKQSRPGLFRRLSGETLDLLIIGGGITGASVFRDAALRGMRVALVEANDFAHTICREAMAIHKGLDPDPRAEPIRAEVRYVCRNEMVCTLEDLLERRAGFLYWSSEQRLERARYGARVIRAELALTEKEFEHQFATYREHLTRFHSLPGGLP